MSVYTDWKNSVIGKHIGDRQCVAVVRDYLKSVYPNVDTYKVLPSVVGAKDLAGKGTAKATWVANNHADVNQLPSQGDIMVFGATPASGYTNKTDNKYGHTGVCDSADHSGYNLTQQNAPHNGDPVNTTHYPWNFRPCLGWFMVGVNQAVTTPQLVSIRLKGNGNQKYYVRETPGGTPFKDQAHGGEQYGAAIVQDGWAQIEFTGKTGYVGPTTYDRV